MVSESSGLPQLTTVLLLPLQGTAAAFDNEDRDKCVMPGQPTPAQLGFRMPAEWEPHTATWLAWPHNRETWPGRFAGIPAVWAKLAELLSACEPVHILAGGRTVMDEARRMIGHRPGVHLDNIPTNDAWIRDFGPTFLSRDQSGETAIVDWTYDAWGGKYPPYDDDRRATERINADLCLRRFAPGVVFEGGAIEVNGRGSVLAGEACLLHAGRNPVLGRSDIERLLADYLAAPHVIWLGRGIAGDDTDGHVDQLARFVGERTVVVSVEEDPEDENFAPLCDNLARLRLARDQDGRRLEIVRLPLPRAIYNGADRLPATYANFYIANGVVVVPTFDDPADRPALETLASCFPARKICPLPANDLIAGLGAVHCITQQQPRPATMNKSRPC